MKQNKLISQAPDDFVESLELTSEKIKQDMEKMNTIEGFPMGDTEDILELSNPPYFTAYPNPYIAKFIEKFGKPYDSLKDEYKREPFVGDISEGKNDPYYNLHTYHTKVPYKAIIPFIQHYTKPGEIVLDGFCGSGMTGIAAGLIERHSILSDLSPAATFISSSTIANVNSAEFESQARLILSEAVAEVDWMYKTRHPTIKEKLCDVNFFVWVDLYSCPFCKEKISVYDLKNNYLHRKSKCEKCGNELPNTIERVVNEKERTVESKMVLVNYEFNGKNHFKEPDDYDFDLLKRIKKIDIPY